MHTTTNYKTQQQMTTMNNGSVINGQQTQQLTRKSNIMTKSESLRSASFVITRELFRGC